MRAWAILLAVSLPFPAFAAQQASQQIAQPRFVLEDGTPVKLVLNQTLSSANEYKGNLVLFAVAEDVKVGDVIVIPKGANAWGTISIAKHKGKIGRAGEIVVSIDKVRLADGEKAALLDVDGGNGDSRQGRMASAMAVSGVVAWPAAPLFLLMNGKDITIHPGAQTLAFVRGDNTLDPARFTPEAIALANNLPPPASLSAPATATVAHAAAAATEAAVPNSANAAPASPAPENASTTSTETSASSPPQPR